MSSTLGKGKSPGLTSWTTRKHKSSHPVIRIGNSTNQDIWVGFWIGETFLFPSGIEGGELFGNPSLEIRVSPSSIAGEDSVSSPTINFSLTISGIDYTGEVGTPTSRITLSALGQIQSQEQLSNVDLNIVISPTGVSALDDFGTPVVQFVLQPNGLSSQEAFGLVQILGDIIREPRLRIALRDIVRGSVSVGDTRKNATEVSTLSNGNIQVSDRKITGVTIDSTQIGEVVVGDDS